MVDSVDNTDQLATSTKPGIGDFGDPRNCEVWVTLDRCLYGGNTVTACPLIMCFSLGKDYTARVSMFHHMENGICCKNSC